MSQNKSLSRNSAFYLIYQVINVVFPFITGMYVARILLPDTVGVVQSAQNIARYFVILSYLGIPTYGLREISKARDKSEDLSKVYSELLILNALSTIVCCIAYLSIVFSIPAYNKDVPLHLITGLGIAFNFLNNSWLFEGLEEFKYISIRNVIVKILSFILLIIFVKSKEDYLTYALITVVGTGGNYILNMFYSRKFIRFTLKGLSFVRHLKPVFALVMVNLAIELYSLVDVTMLNLISENRNVAYYSYASKINSIILQVVNSFTMVIVPRLALYYSNNQKKDFNHLITKTLNTIIVISLPIIIGIQFVSEDAIILIYGSEYEPASPVLKILCFIISVSPIGYLLGSRTLLVTNHENKMIIAVGIGAVTNIIGNAILIPHYAEIGASIASVSSSLIMSVVYIMLGRRYYIIESTIIKELGKVVVGIIIMSLCLFFVKTYISSRFFRLIIEVFIGVASYFTSLLIFKESLIKEYTNKIMKKIQIRKGF